MKQDTDLVLDVWRECSRNLQFEETTLAIAPLVFRQLPADLLLVRRIDIQSAGIECAGIAASGLAQPPVQPRVDCSREDLERLVAWCRSGRLLELPAGQGSEEFGPLVPAGVTGEVLAVPLGGSMEVLGFLVLSARPPESFTPAQQDLVRALVEPLGVALENDLRLHELWADREAAQADRRALLAKLGRPAITGEIVGADSGLSSVMERVAQVCRSDLPVLLFGETGSGKEVVARAIHTRSARATGPFLRANCGAIPSELIDSELFGHERGSFTGATDLRKGWFERADGGTLFLDEVGELPPAAQVRLLQVLQDGTFERVGGQRQLKVDVRIVAATHRDLQQMVARGSFREDLWYRMAVFPVVLPPLRERLEDIPALAAHLALRSSRRFGLPYIAPTLDDINLLMPYAWPGNVRELAAVIDRAVILGNGKRLEIARSLGITQNVQSPGPPATPAASEAVAPGSFPALDEVIVKHIEAALAATRGRIEGPGGAARLLDVNPHTLRARMRKLGIVWQRFRG